MTALPVRVRPYVESDAGAVYGPWLEAFQFSHGAGPIPMDLYWPTYREAVRRLLAKPTVEVLVACSTEDDDQIFGWLAREKHEPPIVHFLWVKQPFRRQGIAKILMAAAGIPTSKRFIYTFKTPTALNLARGTWRNGERSTPWIGAVYDPLKARFAENRPRP